MNYSENLGKQRQSVHPNGTPRYYNDPNKEDVVGVSGEYCFGLRYKLKVDEAKRPDGDKGIDFVVKIFYRGKMVTRTIDVKTAQKPYNLLVKSHEINRCADILVLAKYLSDNNVDFLGWTTRREMKQCPQKVFSSLGILNYYKPASDLRPMSELDEILKHIEQVKVD